MALPFDVARAPHGGTIVSVVTGIMTGVTHANGIAYILNQST